LILHQIQSELAVFDSWTKTLAAKAGQLGFDVREECPHGFSLWPHHYQRPKSGILSKKKIALSFLGITHGNEVAGLKSLNETLRLIDQGMLPVRIPMAFFLGNVPAARKNTRFLERDLNRSFMTPSTSSAEERRAKELETPLGETAYLVDFHQVTARAAEPFFIFPYSRAGYTFARHIAPERPIVTHWDSHFSDEGRCTDEFVIDKGGVGISIELGQNGFDPYQVATGTLTAVKAILVVEAYASVGAAQQLPPIDPVHPKHVYSWAAVMAYPDGKVALDPGWYNFQAIEKGVRLGTVDGQVITAPASGMILFPKYIKQSAEPSEVQRPTELMRILRLVGPNELPV